MFSIAAINDTDSRDHWEPLAPTKEAQEFHLSQIYQDGLLQLQAKEYEKARELLETVLKDPLLTSGQVDKSGSDGHLLQLRFLALKNLATVFLQQGSTYYESALHCYLQAVEIDSKDSVVWNQLGTLSCSMGLLSISRWAFEQGLLCSPNNWNCMEKLLEVLIAIGDEVACFSVAGLIIRHWPSHSRALHVKHTIEESEPTPFFPRGIDKLEPQHVRLKFLDKRKATTHDLEESVAAKKLNQDIELNLAEASWTALADVLLGILVATNECDQGANESYRSGDIRLIIRLHSRSENVSGSLEGKRSNLTTTSDHMFRGVGKTEQCSVSKEKESSLFEETHQERRSSRLERLRSRKPGKEESDFAASKDLVKIVPRYLESFIMGESGARACSQDTSHLLCAEVMTDAQNNESIDVARFVLETSKNYGAYHMGHLLLEEISQKAILYRDTFANFLELEKVTRSSGQSRTPECSLFLAELYYDFGIRSLGSSTRTDFMSEASYHLCKIIESVALDYTSHSSGMSENSNYPLEDGFLSVCKIGSLLNSKRSFWVRFFWLSGKLSDLNGNKEEAQKEFGVALSLLTRKEHEESSVDPISLPHCKVMNELTADWVLHEINLLEVDFLLGKTVSDMIQKDLHLECINLLAPLMFCKKDAHLAVSSVLNRDSEGITSVELSALDVLIKACEKSKPINIDVYLRCHMRKLQILMAAAGVEECFGSLKSFDMSKFKALASFETGLNESSITVLHTLLSEEVKAISQCALEMKNSISLCGSTNGSVIPVRIISDIQSMLLAVMCNIVTIYFSKKSLGLDDLDQNERRQRCSFVDAAIAFFRLQHLNPNVPVKTQIELIVAMHEMLAEYGLCCASGDGEEEGTFLKLAIKHLLYLDMRLKSNSVNRVSETAQGDTRVSQENHVKTYGSDSNESEAKVGAIDIGKTGIEVTDATGNGNSSHKDLEKGKVAVECGESAGASSNGMLHQEEASSQLLESGKELTEDEREELEMGIDSALDQCFFCLYGLQLRSDSSYEDDLAMHKNTSRGDYQTKEQCADVFQYILPYAKASSKTGLVKLRRVLRAIRKHFPQPPDRLLDGNAIDKFLDNPDLCENELSEDAGRDGFRDAIMSIIYPNAAVLKQQTTSMESAEPYMEVYRDLYYLLAQSEEMSATDKWAGFVLTNEGEEFVQQTAKLFKYDLLFNPLRFESWQRLATIYDEEVDLLLNDGSKQINVTGWRKNATLPQRVDTSRRRSRRCLLMTLALAGTANQQVFCKLLPYFLESCFGPTSLFLVRCKYKLSVFRVQPHSRTKQKESQPSAFSYFIPHLSKGEIHELLALVYYDGLQNVVPIYDQRSNIPVKDAAWRMFCQNSMKHFEKAFAQKEDWSYLYYLGKLSEKLKCSRETSFSYYDKAIALNPSAVDPFYRMHASRLKLLWTCAKDDKGALKVAAMYSFNQLTKDTVMHILGSTSPENSYSVDFDDKNTNKRSENLIQAQCNLGESWDMLYSDCLSALQICVEGDLKHFHKARYMLAQGLYRKGEGGDLERAKDELSFCFKSSRSPFTINMWEIDSTVKKGRRKTPGVAGNKRALEVNLAESSRKFITCIRKYLLFYTKLLEETGDIGTLDRAYISLRADKRFSLCLEDLVPIALGRYVKALISSVCQNESENRSECSSLEHLLEKLFSLFIEQMTLWSDICNLPEIKCPELSEGCLYGYLFKYIQILERNCRLETLEGINEKMRKRLKNPKLSSNSFAKVYKHVSVAWYRCLVISMASITPLNSRFSSETQAPAVSDGGPVSGQLLCVDVQTDEFWKSSFEDPNHLKHLEKKWSTLLSTIKDVVIKKAAEENLETASMLLRSCYNFYRDASCAVLPSGINLYVVPCQLTEGPIQSSVDAVDILDMNTSKKLLLWAYGLLHARCITNITVIMKSCEETAKSKMKKGGGSSSTSSTASIPSAVASQTGKDVGGISSEKEVSPLTNVINMDPAPNETQDPGTAESSKLDMETNLGEGSATLHVAETDCNVVPTATAEDQAAFCRPNDSPVGESRKILSATPLLLHCNNTDSEMKNVEKC